jgi:signal transduction histidine kinase/CheY-like chemotaxis protein
MSFVGAWALAFGCAVGWDAFVLPGTTFLPMAGPLGTALGVLVGAVIMAVVAWNFHFMLQRKPGPGGVYTFATEAFGADHGFIAAWFLCLTYMAIVWMDATVLVSVARHLLGKDWFLFGFRYTVAGFDVSLGHILLTAAGIALAAAVCCRRPFSRWVQTTLALVMAAGIVVCFCAAWERSGEGWAGLAPWFAEGEGAGSPLKQVMGIVAMSPWLFVGFEAVANVSGGWTFPRNWAFASMALALAASVVAYAMLTAIPALSPPWGAMDWADGLGRLGGAAYPAYEVVSKPLGKAGFAVMLSTMVGAVFTNLIGNTVAASRMMAAMAQDGVLPKWFGKYNGEGAATHAVWAIAALAVGIAALGRTVISIIVDISVVGAGIAYAYASAATYRLATLEGDRFSRATGWFGTALSAVLSVMFILPNVESDTLTMSTHSYLVVVVWCIAGLVCFLWVFRRDRSGRFGQSTVVWPSLVAVILAMSVMWIRQTTDETTQEAFQDIIRQHADVCEAGGSAVEHDPHAWRGILKEKLRTVNRSIVRNSLVQLGLTAFSLALMLALFGILRRRERDHEREKAQAKSYFFSTVSHDIRTPLNAIIGFSEMLRSGIDDPQEREQALDSILVSGRTLLGLVNDVLDLSKLESGKMEIVPEPTDCARLLHGVVDAFRVVGAKGVELRCLVGEMPPLVLDPQRLRQIVFNIVGNAVKFTERGFIELRARYEREAGAEDGVFSLEVEDTGCGIGEEDLKRLGNAYVQVVGAHHRQRNGGTGLGLAICRQLAGAMGGKLGVVSTPGKGSVFSVVIPRVKPAPEGAEVHDGTAAGLAHTTAPAGGARGARHVLLVDDSKLNLMVLQTFLKHMGEFEIALAKDGQEALEVLRAPGGKPFDLVLTDMWMPRMDGEGLLRAIRDDPSLKDLRVVIVTADVEMHGKATAMGFDGLLFKPVTAAKLAKILAAGKEGAEEQP